MSTDAWAPAAARLQRQVALWAGVPVIQRDFATHEAAHAVVSIELDEPCAGVALGSSIPGVFGQMWAHGPRPTAHQGPLTPPSAPVLAAHNDRLFMMAAVYYAGTEGERIAAGIVVDVFYREDSDDHQNAEALLAAGWENVTRSTAPRCGCQKLARLILRERWHAVTAVAAKLSERGEMNRAEIDEEILRADDMAAARKGCTAGRRPTCWRALPERVH